MRAVVSDQRRIFTAPVRIRPRDVTWLLPLAGTFGYLLASDQRNMSERIHTNTLSQDRSLRVSNAGTAALAGIPLFLYWRGWHEGDNYARDTGVLSARALVDSLLAAELLRAVTERQRPDQGAGAGLFFHGQGVSSSFPSMHSTAAWALASVVADRYPGWLTQTGAYGLAAAVSFGRVAGREHFPSDVFAGSALGWLVGRYVSRTSARTGHVATSRLLATVPEASPKTRASSAGSLYIPMDSWIYSALDRLAALGLIPSQTSGLRPWTRAECRRQVLEAEESPVAYGTEIRALLRALHSELDTPNPNGSAVALQSVYVRGGAIAGPMLNDSMHFGQTWSNDSGRPFGRGWNGYTGFTAYAESGPVFGSVQAEYQHAPASGPYSLEVRQTIAQLDGTPLQAGETGAAVDRFRAVEAYAGIRLANLEVSVGKQALWWGPGFDSPLSFGSNAEPTKNLKLSTVHPIRLPSLFGIHGGIRAEFIIGKLGGQKYTWRPWFNAQKISFKLTENLELGFTRWSIFWGLGHPITLGSFARNFTSLTSPDGPAGVGRNDPGDRKGGFDFRYRVPGLRNWLTVYSDSYSDDDPSPLAAPRRAAINPGIYLTRVPALPRLDLRLEAPSTTPLGATDLGGQFIYFNNQYRGGNTNYSNLLGNSVGRDGRALQARSTYWLSARNRIELDYRQTKTSARFLAGGATQSDAGLKTLLELAPGWFTTVAFQYERFWVPILGGPHRNLSGWVQLTWEPGLQLGQASKNKKELK